MVEFVRFVEAFCVVAAFLHLTSIVVVAARARAARPPRPASPDAPGVSVVRPVCGLENQIEATLRSTFRLTYPRYEILLCVASERDPVIPLVRSLIAEHPNVSASLLVGDDQISVNPKLNNCVKGWDAAVYGWIVLCDSNVLMPPDYLEQLLDRADAETAIVSAPPAGSDPEGAWAELECAFLNTYQARWQLAADAVGLGFAHGKNMLWRREILDDAGGIRALAAEPAEDAAGTKIVRARDMKVHLVPHPFLQPLGHRRLGDVWRRQLRWARLRRASFKRFFIPEILSGGFIPLLGLLFLVAEGAVPVLPALACVVAWYGAECALAWTLSWPLSWRAPFLAVMRDAMLPFLWIGAVSGNKFEWRGTPMNIGKPAEPERSLQLAEE